MYLTNKYTKWYYNIIHRAQNRTLTEYSEKHHIIPKSLGGSNDKENLAVLTAREHFICHWLLTKMVTGKSKQKMAFALKLLVQNNTKSSRVFEYCKSIIVSMDSPLKGRKFNRTSWNKNVKMDTETKQKLSAALKDTFKNGRPVSSTTFKAGRVPHNANKRWFFKSPDGIVYETDNVTRFCKAKGLSTGPMCLLSKGRRGYKSHRGWTVGEDTTTKILECYNTV